MRGGISEVFARRPVRARHADARDDLQGARSQAPRLVNIQRTGDLRGDVRSVAHIPLARGDLHKKSTRCILIRHHHGAGTVWHPEGTRLTGEAPGNQS